MTRRYAHELQAGDRYDSLEFVVTPEFNQQLMFAVEDYDPMFVEGRDGRGALVHPVVLMQMTPRTRSPSFRQAPGMGSAFARDTATFEAPAHVGEPLRIDWVVTRTYEQRGKIYQDYVATVTDRDGRMLMRREMSSTFFTRGTVKSFPLGETR